MSARTVHHKGAGPVIHWDRREWRPATKTEMATGDRVLVAPKADGGLAVKRPGRRGIAPTETWIVAPSDPLEPS